MKAVWRLDTPVQTLLLAIREAGLPEVAHWGAPLPADEDLVALTEILLPRERTSGMPDVRPPLTLCPLQRDGHGGTPGLELVEGDVPALAFAGAEYEPRRRLVARFEGGGLALEFTIAADAETDVITLATRARGPRIRRLAAPALPGPATGTSVTTFAGRWIGEFRPREIPWDAGGVVAEVRDGRTSHHAYPGLLIPAGPLRHETGEVFALALGQSTGHRLVVETLPDGRRQVQIGPVLHPDGDTDVTAGTLYATRSAEGVNGIVDAFHRHQRARLVRFAEPTRPRPVHYNSWEAVYFDHDLDTLKDIAIRAAALGAERFVLDDGWFEGRNDDTTSLGDWRVDRRKYPDGLGPLVAHVNALGMGFGLWVEPEMVSPVSALAREHPDWILGPADQGTVRNQLVLDLTKPEVGAYLFGCLDALLSDYAIDYLKWDHNRPLPGPDHRQAAAWYELVERMRAAHPHVEIESCASGGGRLDFGALARTQRVWLSDSNDALARLRIQHEALPFLIPEVGGSHVGPRLCHTSRRVLPMTLRAWTAAQRSMGFEMDPRELDAEEAETLARVTAWWKARRDWLLPAERLRLDTDDPDRLVEVAVARDRSRFALWSARLDAAAHYLPSAVRVPGLDPHARYRVEIADRRSISPASSGEHPLRDGAVVVSGAALAAAGLRLPVQDPNDIIVIEGKRLP